MLVRKSTTNSIKISEGLFSNIVLGCTVLLFFIASSFYQIGFVGISGLIVAIIHSLVSPLHGVYYLLTLIYWPVNAAGLPVVKIFTAVLLFIWVYHFLNRGIRFKFDAIVILFLFWIFFSIFSCLYSPNSKIGLGHLQSSISGAVLYFVLIQFIETKQDVYKVAFWLLIVGGIGFAITLIHVKTGLTQQWIDEWSFNPENEAKRLISYGSEPNYHSALMLPAIGIGIALVETAKEFKAKLLYTALFLLSLSSTLGTFSKSALLSVGVTAVSFSAGRIKRLLFLLPLALVALYFVLQYEGLYERYTTIYDNVVEKGGTGRFTAWGWALEDWLDSPLTIVLGNGMGAFFHTHKHLAHNTFMTLLADGGLALLLPFVTLLITVYKRLQRSAKKMGRPNHDKVLFQGLAASLLGTCAMYMTVTDLRGLSLCVLLGLATKLIQSVTR